MSTTVGQFAVGAVPALTGAVAQTIQGQDINRLPVANPVNTQIGLANNEAVRLTESFFASSDFYDPDRILKEINRVTTGFQPTAPAAPIDRLIAPNIIPQNAKPNSILSITNSAFDTINTSAFGTQFGTSLNAFQPNAFVPAIPDIGVNAKPLDVLAAPTVFPLGASTDPVLAQTTPAVAAGLGPRTVALDQIGNSGSTAMLNTPVMLTSPVVSAGLSQPVNPSQVTLGGQPVVLASPLFGQNGLLPASFSPVSGISNPLIGQFPLGNVPTINPFPLGETPNATTILTSTTNFTDQLLNRPTTFNPGPGSFIQANPFGGIQVINPLDPQSSGTTLFYPNGFNTALATSFPLGANYNPYPAYLVPTLSLQPLSAVNTVTPTALTTGLVPISATGATTGLSAIQPGQISTLNGTLGLRPLVTVPTAASTLTNNTPIIPVQRTGDLTFQPASLSVADLSPIPDVIPLNKAGDLFNFLTQWSRLNAEQRQMALPTFRNPTTLNQTVLSNSGLTASGGLFGRGRLINPFQQAGFITDSQPSQRFNSSLAILDSKTSAIKGSSGSDLLRANEAVGTVIDGGGGRDAIIGSAAGDLIQLGPGSAVLAREGNDALIHQASSTNVPTLTLIDGGPGVDTLIVSVDGDPTQNANQPRIQAVANQANTFGVVMPNSLEQLLLSGVERFVITDRQGNVGQTLNLSS